MNGFYKKHILKDGRELTVRSEVPSDAEDIISFVNRTDTESRFLSREPGEFTYTVEQERDIIKRNLDDENAFWAVACVEPHGIIGNLNLNAVSWQSRYKHRATMGLAILKDFWNLGVGSAALGDAIEWLRGSKYERLELYVVADNERAVALYKKKGFVITGTRPRALKYGDGTYADDYFMSLDIKEGL